MIGLPVLKESPNVATESRFVSPAPYIVSFDIVLLLPSQDRIFNRVSAMPLTGMQG
jgi:hypothetical protein